MIATLCRINEPIYKKVVFDYQYLQILCIITCDVNMMWLIFYGGKSKETYHKIIAQFYNIIQPILRRYKLLALTITTLETQYKYTMRLNSSIIFMSNATITVLLKHFITQPMHKIQYVDTIKIIKYLKLLQHVSDHIGSIIRETFTVFG